MSINVTISGNPINVRRGNMELSDLDRIKKCERERLKRLRREQVQEQSKAISKRVLERVRKAQLEQLNNLEKNGDTEMRKAHERKLMEINKRYQDIDNIGYAHVNAANQPDPEAIKKLEDRINEVAARERAFDAAKKLRESANIIDERNKHFDRLNKVRETENARSSMVAQLARNKSIPDKIETLNLSTDENYSINSTPKSLLRKKSLSKKTKKKSRLPKHVSVMIDKNDICSDSVSETELCKKSEHQYCTNEPRTEIPTSSLSKDMEKILKYNPDDYRQDTSTDLGRSNSSSSISDDSSYFSDTCSKTPVESKSCSQKASPISNRIKLYDHDYRHRNTYERPTGLVEKLNLKNRPNAAEVADRITDLENEETKLLNTQRKRMLERTDNACKTEKKRRDYQALIKQLDNLTQKEKRLEANLIGNCAEEKLHLPNRNNENIENRQIRMDREVENILRSSKNLSSNDSPIERVITTPSDNNVNQGASTSAQWTQPNLINKPSTSNQIPDTEIVKLLLKLENLKKSLLTEYGASLPDTIFNASVKPLFEQSTQSNSSKECKNDKEKTSPEIQVINMSSCDENIQNKPKKYKVNKKFQKTIPDTKLSRARAKKNSQMQDKEIQVELSNGESSENKNKYPLEPIVKISNPENESSSSESLDKTDLLIDVSKNEITLVQRESKSELSNTSSKSLITNCTRSRTPVKISFGNNTNDGTNMFTKLVIDKKEIILVPGRKNIEEANNSNTLLGKKSKSEPSSRQSSPKKCYSRTKSFEKLNENIIEKTFKTQCTQVSINSSTTNSSSSSNIDTELYSKIYKLETSKRIFKKINDNSDASTTYASPPIANAGAFIRARNNSTPILEMLDSSTNENYSVKRNQLSPVSSPETPSPRTMRLPSNKQNLDKINKRLKFSNNDCKIHPNKENYKNHSSIEDNQKTNVCSCKNPTCKLIHKIEDSQKNLQETAPELLKNYEVLQNFYTERIASLDNLIEKVRNEKDVNFSMCQPQSSKEEVNDLVKNIVTLHANLKKTLYESQKIISAEGMTPKRPLPYNELEKSPSLSDISKNTTSDSTKNDDENKKIPTMKSNLPKPKIINDERVNISLSRFKNPQRNIKALNSQSHCNDDVIKKLSQEILEQSNSLNKSLPENVNDSNISCLKSSKIASGGNEDSNTAANFIDNSKDPNSSKVENADFVPLLAGIPKTPRPLQKVSLNNRTRPPVSLISGPYRPDIVSPAHELSTIVEFDTPDTVNKSQSSIRTPHTTKQIFKSNSKNLFPKNKSHSQNLNLKFSKISTNQSSEKVNNFYEESNSSDSLHTLPDVSANHLDESQNINEKSYNFKSYEASGLQTLPDENINVSNVNESNLINNLKNTCSNESDVFKNNDALTSTSSASFLGLSGVSEITTTPSSDINLFKCPTSPDEMDLALESFGLRWALQTLKKTREASALSSSSNSDVTPMNTRRLLSTAKKSESVIFSDISDVSSISMKFTNKSTEKSLLVRGRTSTPMRRSNSNSEGSISTLSKSSDFNAISKVNGNLSVPNLSLLNYDDNKKNNFKNT